MQNLGGTTFVECFKAQQRQGSQRLFSAARAVAAWNSSVVIAVGCTINIVQRQASLFGVVNAVIAAMIPQAPVAHHARVYPRA